MNAGQRMLIQVAAIFGAMIIAAILCLSSLLDGPSDIEAIQATADAKNDAIKSAAISPIDTGARGQNDQQTIVAAVQP